jgi:hypothetical protein
VFLAAGCRPNRQTRCLPHIFRQALSVSVLLLLTSGCNKSGGKPDAQLNAKLDAISQAGYPVTLAELNAWYVEPPAAENAAPLYGEAFAALAPVEATSPSFLAQNQKALEFLHQAASRKKCRYPLDLTKGHATLLPHLREIKKCAQLLSQAANSHAAKGQMGPAAQSLLDGLHLARSVEEEPVLISYLLRIASETIMQTGLESVLNRKAFTDEQLVRLQAAFREAESGGLMTRSLAGERCFAIATFQMPPPEQAKTFTQMEGAAKSMDTGAYRKSSTYNADFDFFLDRMDECVKVTTLPFPQRLEATSQWADVSEARTKGYQISGLLLPALEKAVENAAQCAGRLRVTQAALAVERYRLANKNALPASLGELAPQFIDSVPSDPFDGQPLRYTKASPKGYVIYSIGKDRKDDGGTPRPTSTNADQPYDLTFAVRR